jgi:protein subunit release factor B
MISAEKNEQLQRRMAALGIEEGDLVEKFVRGTGSGGQKINKTSSTVYLKHKPSGIEIKCQVGRSQAMNRFQARTELCDKIEARRKKLQLERRQAAEKKRRAKRKRPRGVKERILKSKHQRSDLKKQRRKPGRDD